MDKNEALHICEILSNYAAYDPHEYRTNYSFSIPGVKIWNKRIKAGSYTYSITATLQNKTLYLSFTRDFSFHSNPGRTKEEIYNETREFLQVFPQIQQFFYSVYQQIKKDITSIEFDAASWDPSRVKLYDRIASRLAKQFNMIFNKIKDGDHVLYQLVPKF